MSSIWVKFASVAFFFVGMFAALLKFGSSMKKVGKNEQMVKTQAQDIIDYDRQQEAAKENKKIREDVAAMSSDGVINELLRDKT